jgi:hypothetical protein
MRKGRCELGAGYLPTATHSLPKPPVIGVNSRTAVRAAAGLEPLCLQGVLRIRRGRRLCLPCRRSRVRIPSAALRSGQSGRRSAGGGVPSLCMFRLVGAASPSHLETREPPRSATARRRSEWACRQASGGDQPRDHGVRVPHFASCELVASPHWRWHGRDEIDYPVGYPRVAGKPAGRADCFDEIGNRPATPAADLVAKETPPAQVPASDGASACDAPTRFVGVRRRRDLDRVPITVQLDHERRVVEVAAPATLERGCDRLEDASVEADRGVSTRAERNPVQIDGCRARSLHGCLEESPRAGPPPSALARTPNVGCPQPGSTEAKPRPGRPGRGSTSSLEGLR